MKISRKVNRYISSHKTINYILKCVRHICDDNFMDIVLDRNPACITLESWGEAFPDKIIYFIEIGSAGDGFCAEYRKMLNYLYYADCHAMQPYIYINKNFMYLRKSDSSMDVNHYENFFMPVLNLAYMDVQKSKTVVRSRVSHLNLAEELKRIGAYEVSDTYLGEMARISKKYIRFNKTIKSYVEDSKVKLKIGQNTLGVHVRGSDFKMNYKGHPVYIPIEEYLEAVKAEWNTASYEQIFLATDDAEALEVFRETFGEKLIYFKDVIRTDGRTSVINLDDKDIDYHYLLGMQIIRDMLTLSSCKSLIAGKSQVSICARIANRAWMSQYHKVTILDKGINANGQYYLG